MEVDESGYSTQQPTVYVGNIGGERELILQVCANGVLLLDGITLLQHIPLDLGNHQLPYLLLFFCDLYTIIKLLHHIVNNFSLKVSF